MNDNNPLARRVLFASFLCVMLGGCGMGLSYLFLSSTVAANVVAGAPGFVAGAVMIGSGLISGALLARHPQQSHLRAEIQESPDL